MKLYDYLPNYITTMKSYNYIVSNYSYYNEVVYDYLPNYITTMKLYDYIASNYYY